ncbi:hypothetical protein C8F04DRAFT_1400596 [Mycena alexandri]|uniref:Uncharacterized protein n=1 Tax=Mycena alexandri TaxID=1745969 RepID=A0AAD6SG37_9AGAR|nr:hypothetical protein C8F04DRAFT_1400596 [Mycena alexandri]
MSPVEDAPQPIDKGKRRAQAEEDPTERTPLLASPSSSLLDDPPPTVARRRLLSKLTTVFLASLVISVLVCVGLALLVWSYASRASHVSPDDILDEGLVFEGPDRVDVLNITWSGGLWVNVEGRMGFDAGSVIGVNAAPDGDGILQDIWKSIGRWGVRRLDRVSVNMSTIYLTSQSDPSVILATIEPSPVVVPLTANPPSDSTWLTHISTPLLIRPTTNTSALIHFVREAWREGSAAVKADVGSIDVRGGALREDSWRKILHSQLSNVRTALRIRIPPIPGIPHTGPVPSLSELITLQSFNVHSSPGSLNLVACATLPDPAPMSFNLTSPALPFVISLPDGDAVPHPIASVSTAPFTLTHPNITLAITGTVLPIPAAAFPLLSTFLTRYLSGLRNPILVSTPHIPDLVVDLDFPAPSPRPQILRNVTIRDMAIRPHGSTFTASGTVYARVVLPKGMDVGLHVGRVLPDVLVFDGEVPEGAEFLLPVTKGDPTSPPIPDPLPAHAFGHIRPEDWLVSQSGPVPSEDGEGAAFAVTAKIVDVPLEVLPGRQKEFSNFVSKVIFGTDGAVAGILGVASVAVDVFGLPLPGNEGGNGEMELSGLPFRGSVLVGKKSLLSVGDAAKQSKKELKRLMDRFLGRGKWREQANREERT